MDSPQPHKIFLITEILEMILLETEMQTLLISAQRVCRRWHDLIQDSNDLQVALFLKPTKSTSPRETELVINPLITKAIQPWLEERHRRLLAIARPDGTLITLVGPEILSILEKDEIFMRNGASWHRMFSYQPRDIYIGEASPNFQRTLESVSMCIDNLSTLLASTSEDPWRRLSRRIFTLRNLPHLLVLGYAVTGLFISIIKSPSTQSSTDLV